MEKGAGRALKAEVQAEIRRRAVLAVKKGQSQTSVAEVFGVSRKAVNNWIKAERKGGLKALEAKKEGRPVASGRILSSIQEMKISQTVLEHTPEEVGLSYALWTRQAIHELIQRDLKLRIAVRTVGDYLKRWGFTPQRPVKHAWQQNSEEVRKWLEIEYPAIRERARKEHARIYWADETGCRSDHVPGRSYSQRGKTPVINISGSRFGCNILSAINNTGNMRFKVFQCNFNQEVFLDFLQRLIRQEKQKVFLIVDGHPVHRGRLVKAWVDEHRRKIVLFFIPGYSPDLNPDEYVNNHLKSNPLNLEMPKNKEDMISQVRRFLFSEQKDPMKIKRYFQVPSVQYAAS